MKLFQVLSTFEIVQRSSALEALMDYNVKLFLPNTFTVYLFDTLSISDNISHDVHSVASTENFVPPNPMSKDVRDSAEAITSFLTHLGSFGV